MLAARASVSPTVASVEVQKSGRLGGNGALVRTEDRISRGPAPGYIERNKAAWDRWAPEHAARGRKAWEQPDLQWGLWDSPESELQLLREVPARADAIELGCGTAAISAWLVQQGLRPVAVDVSPAQLKTAERLQVDFGLSFPLICANAEEVPFDNASFEVAISEYGASLWCNPRRWLPEAHRLLRPNGRLIFFTNAAMLMVCTPGEGGAAGDVLMRDYFSSYRVEFPLDEAVEFHLTHGHWIRLLRATGFVLENLVEIRPQPEATPRFEFVSLEWARRWPSEEIWVARKVA
jgi:SAM-dependent methyltransferase